MRRLEEARPDGFLRGAAGEPRGFWARGGRWVAHAGAVARVAVEDGPERFRRVRELAEAILRTGDGDPGPQGRARWYGGFAFADDRRASRFWDPFPPALFLLPRLELEGDARGTRRLRIRAPVEAGEDPEEVRARLEEELEATRVRLLGEPETGAAGPGEGALSALWSDGPERDGGARRRPGGGAVEGRETDRGAFEAAVREALVHIEAGRLSKVVLARTLDVTTEAVLDPVDVVGALREENRGTHVYLFEPAPGRVLVGAAPETVATLRKGVFRCTAVAGSTRRGETPEETRRLAVELLASRKDRAEQRMVVEDVVARLAPLVERVSVEEEPHVLPLARIQHLETGIRGRTSPNRHVLELLEAVHPTPAVCGLPRDEALVFLREEEPFERGWYAGPVGWFDGEGDGVFAPALRSAVARGRSWRLFAGAGIVTGSRPEAEWEETRIKFEPVLRALEVVGGGDAGPGDAQGPG